MPQTEVILYQEAGNVPLLDWLDDLEPAAQAKCIACLRRLEKMGHELRRPEADYLGKGIYELRRRHGRVNLRMLYFFHGTWAVVVSHGLKKESEVPAREIELAVSRKVRFQMNPSNHSFKGKV